MLNIDIKRNELINELSQQYATNMINVEEYERILEYINKIETKKELAIIEKIVQENITGKDDKLIAFHNDSEKHLTLFSWRSSNLKPVNGNAGKYTSLFGTNRIIIDDLPKGKTILNVNSIFGLTEIIISKKIKIINRAVPILAGIFMPIDTIIESPAEEMPELHITGIAIFGNITIRRN